MLIFFNILIYAVRLRIASLSRSKLAEVAIFVDQEATHCAMHDPYWRSTVSLAEQIRKSGLAGFGVGDGTRFAMPAMYRTSGRASHLWKSSSPVKARLPGDFRCA